MPRRFTLGAVVTMCKQQVDAEGQESISTSEWKRMISTVYAELYGAVVATGMRYFETFVRFTTDGTNVLDEPDDHLSTVGIDFIVNAAGERRELIEVMAQERNRFAGLNGEAVAFAMVDDQFRLYPTPPSGQTYELVYVAQPPHLTAQADDFALDVVTPDGEAFLLWGVAVMALGKEDSDTSLARAERAAAKERLVEFAVLRALNAPRRVMAGQEFEYRDPADYWGRGGNW